MRSALGTEPHLVHRYRHDLDNLDLVASQTGCQLVAVIHPLAAIGIVHRDNRMAFHQRLQECRHTGCMRLRQLGHVPVIPNSNPVNMLKRSYLLLEKVVSTAHGNLGFYLLDPCRLACTTWSSEDVYFLHRHFLFSHSQT